MRKSLLIPAAIALFVVAQCFTSAYAGGGYNHGGNYGGGDNGGGGNDCGGGNNGGGGGGYGGGGGSPPPSPPPSPAPSPTPSGSPPQSSRGGYTPIQLACNTCTEGAAKYQRAFGVMPASCKQVYRWAINHGWDGNKCSAWMTDPIGGVQMWSGIKAKAAAPASDAAPIAGTIVKMPLPTVSPKALVPRAAINDPSYVVPIDKRPAQFWAGP